MLTFNYQNKGGNFMFGKIKNEISTEVATMNIGNNIAALRKEKGITQEELANIGNKE